jgi:hypothetical protein
MKMEPQPAVRTAMLRMFVYRNEAQPFWIILENCLEAMTYLLAIHANQEIRDIVGEGFTQTFVIFCLLLGLLVLRAVCGVVAIKMAYPIILSLGLYEATIEVDDFHFVVVSLFLLTLLLIMDVLSNIRLDFEQGSITAETLNFSKILHAFFFLFGIVNAIVCPSPYGNIIASLFFASLAVIKAFSMMPNPNYKEILIRIYLLLAIDHLVHFMGSLLPLPTIAYFVTPLIVSSFLYSVYDLKRSQVKLDELYSQ